MMTINLRLQYAPLHIARNMYYWYNTATAAAIQVLRRALLILSLSPFLYILLPIAMAAQGLKAQALAVDS